MKFFAYVDFGIKIYKVIMRMPNIHSILCIKKYYKNSIYSIKYISIYDKPIFIDTNGKKNS